MDRNRFIDAKRIVVKVGTSVLASGDGGLDRKWFDDFSRQVGGLIKERKKEIIIVSSGAIAAGMHLLGMKKRPRTLPEQQACAAIGQGLLINAYRDSFEKEGLCVAQILLTREDIRDRHRYLNAENTLRTLLDKSIVPIINENDTVAIEEIKFGDNDTLSALSANLVGAELLIILTDVEGFRLPQKKEYLDIVKEIDFLIEKSAGLASSEYSTGGMKTKLEACKICMSSGIYCVIANGRRKNVLVDILNGERIGTLFVPKKARLKARKRWVAYNARPRGRIIVDEGARSALVEKHSSLLACGVKSVEGDFSYGDVVSIVSIEGVEFARGLSNYSSTNLEKIKGKNTKEAEKILKENFYEEVVHRDNLVIL